MLLLSDMPFIKHEACTKANLHYRMILFSITNMVELLLLSHDHVCNMDRVKRIWYLSPMRAAKVQASLRIRAVSPEPPLLAHTSSESRGTFRQKARSLAPLNGWVCAVKICHDGMLEDTNSLDAARIMCIKPVGMSRDCITSLCVSFGYTL